MFECISKYLRNIVAGIMTDNTPSDKEILEKRKIVKKPTQSVEIVQKCPEEEEKKEIEIKKSLPDVQERDERTSKRPHIKPPRRQPTYQKEWSGEGSREKRKQYQKEYRAEHGNGYFPKG